MINKNSYIIFIDTLNDINSNPSNFRVKINDHMIRNNIKNNFQGKSEWFLSIKTFCMLNSFSNISKNINDEIHLYVNKTTIPKTFDINSYALDFDLIILKIKEGNPSVGEIQTNLNFDSFCSVENGQSNVLSNIPTVLGTQNRTFFLQGVGSNDVLLGEYRVGNIVHESKNIVNAHKTLSDKNVTSIRLLVKGFENDVRWCNTNITYVIEIRWLL